MELYSISKGDWTFILTKSGCWQMLYRGKHFAYIKSDEAMKALAVIDE